MVGAPPGADALPAHGLPRPHDRPLDVAVRDLVEARTGRRPAGPVRPLAHLRHVGVCFNPVAFDCRYATDERLEAVVAKVTNTPWQEHHANVLAAATPDGDRAARVWRSGKEFHVWPLMLMDMEYEWRSDMLVDRLRGRIRNLRRGQSVSDATPTLARGSIGAATLAAALARFPLMTVGAVARIDWQALRLWPKRAPFHPHPEKP